ncbi:30S ribosomal protein S12 methylthiotransferase RimO [candidate division KSB1 bacterium]|nr:30S ribosomal protein S12 methylthiotransferase RimO [candidate division KSB1 bacterium]RQV99956.1 MAG: 30S ribosomal protein S12 methylthiotransferase RimO [candidate division KSB1 bacterium]
MKLAYLNLGCPKNQVDLETILGGLVEQTDIVEETNGADTIVINTCAFIESAKRESIDAIFDIISLKQINPNLKVLVTGCLPQRYKNQIANLVPEVDQFFFAVSAESTLTEIQKFLQLPVSRRTPRHLLNPPHYAYLRIADGCNNRCSYCAIPLIKGQYQSRPFDEIEQEALQLAARGVKEIVLIAQDTTYYGADLPIDLSLENVLTALNEVDGIEWIRLLYTHPAHWSDELIGTMACLKKVVPYVDIPIQHISDPLLQKMGRRVTRAQIEKLVFDIRRRIPDIALRTSIITGFPGETEEDFTELYDFLQEMHFERLGVFTYSHEEDTLAFLYDDDIPESVKLERQRQIMQLQDELAEERNARLIGRVIKVIVDEVDTHNNIAYARSQWDAPEIDGNILLTDHVLKGEFYNVRIDDAQLYDLTGMVVFEDGTNVC